jgi:DNA mismatch endonuclease (patch repair protein)
MTIENPEARSRIMRAVKSSGTGPEKKIRKLLSGWGFRYRLNREDLPGKPDIVIPKSRKIILIHGCFWHGHRCKRGNRIPKNNRSYWQMKIRKNKARDRLVRKSLHGLNWQVLTVWECEVSSKKIETKIRNFLTQ